MLPICRRVYKIAMVRMSSIALTKLRMYGSIKRDTEMWLCDKGSRCGFVTIPPVNNHIVFQALSCRQAHSKNLRLYVQIGLSERGKQFNIALTAVVVTKKISAFSNCESGGTT